MKLIYRCLHCGQAKQEAEREFVTTGGVFLKPGAVIAAAFSTDVALKRQLDVGAYQPHPCAGGGVIGVAQLVAIVEN